MALIFYASSQSDPAPGLTTAVSDKLLHALCYAGLAALFCRALLDEDLSAVSALTLAILLTSTYGASDEYHQRFVPMRSSDMGDWAGDSVGAVFGSMAYLALRRAQGLRDKSVRAPNRA